MSNYSESIPPEVESELPAEKSWLGHMSRFFVRRYPIWPVMDLIRKKTVPVHRWSFLYSLGGVVLFFLVAQIITGILLMVYYRSSEPWQSVLRISEEIPYGEVIRSVHAWGTNLMIVAVLAHFASTLFLKAYRPPRELTWITGLGLLGLTLAFGFVGYLLPWDELSFFATKVGITEVGKMPLIGPWVAELLRGGADVSNDTLGRFFVMHVVLLPLAILGLVSVHLLFIQVQGISEPDSFQNLPQAKKRTIRFFTGYLPREVALWFVLALGLLGLAVYFPREMMNQIQPYAPAPEGIKPEWYFLPNYQYLKLFPGKWDWFGPISMSLAPLLFLALPFVDKTVPTNRFGRLVTILAAFMLAGVVGLGFWGYYSH